MNKKLVQDDSTDELEREYARACPRCKEEFQANHMNRDFCSPKCHDYHNNRKSANVTILMRLILEGITEVSPDELEEAGVDFRLFSKHNISDTKSIELELRKFKLRMIGEKKLKIIYND